MSANCHCHANSIANFFVRFHSGQHYYWNTKANTVAWLPPSHPDAVISDGVGTLRKELDAPKHDDIDDIIGTEAALDRTDAEYNSENNYPNVAKELPPMPPPKRRDLEKTLRAKSERRSRRDPKEGALDPMDPAAYSDIAR